MSGTINVQLRCAFIKISPFFGNPNLVLKIEKILKISIFENIEFLDKTFGLKDIPKYQIRRYFELSKEVRPEPFAPHQTLVKADVDTFTSDFEWKSRDFERFEWLLNSIISAHAAG